MAAIINGVPVALPPPDGYVVDFDNPRQNSVPAAYWLFGVFNVLALLFILQRGYVRLVLQRKIQIEDACILIAYIFSVVLQILIIREFIRKVMGVHGWEMSLTHYGYFLKALYLLPILYNPVQCGSKLTLLLLYRRLTSARWFQIEVWIVMFFVVGSSVGIMFAAIFPCSPVRAAFDITVTKYTCIDRPNLYKATAILGAITDLMVLAVPIPVVIPLKMRLRQKVGLIALFCVGGVTVFTSIMRLVALINSMGSVDQSWGGGPVLLWIFVETNMSTICGCLPTMKLFLNHVAPHLLGSSIQSSNYQAPSNLNGGPTIGSSGLSRHDKYSRFDSSTMYPLQTVVVGAEAGAQGQQRQDKGQEKRRHWESESNSDKGDGGSDHAIIQTHTTTVEFHKR